MEIDKSLDELVAERAASSRRGGGRGGRGRGRGGGSGASPSSRSGAGGGGGGSAGAGGGGRRGRGALSSGGGRRQRSDAAGAPVRRSPRGGGAGDRGHLRGATVDQIAGAKAGQRVLKVSSETQSKSIAGSIAHVAREGECPRVLACGALSVNQALKGVIIARDYLEEDSLDFTVQVNENRDVGPDAMEFVLTKVARRPAPAHASDSVTLQVAAASDPGKVAGAVAGKIREGERVALSAIGPDSVKILLKAYILARKYVTDDGLDLTLRPEFHHIERDGETVSGIITHVLASQV